MRCVSANPVALGPGVAYETSDEVGTPAVTGEHGPRGGETLSQVSSERWQSETRFWKHDSGNQGTCMRIPFNFLK